MSSACAQGDADVVEALEEAVPGGVVERERRPRCRWPGAATRAPLDVDGDLERRVGLDGPQQLLADLGRRPAPGTRPFLVQLLRKMSAKRGEITAWKP